LRSLLLEKSLLRSLSRYIFAQTTYLSRTNVFHLLQLAKGNVKAPKFIRYTPDTSAPGFNPNARQRVIRMVEAQVDPMEPPKFKHRKVARGETCPDSSLDSSLRPILDRVFMKQSQGLHHHRCLSCIRRLER
jgi:hypothetical protein